MACFLLVRQAGAEPRRVDVVVAGPAERAEPVEKAMRDPLSRLPIEVRLTRADAVAPKAVIDGSETAASAFARVWVDLVADDQVTLYFVDSAWERILVRRVPIERGLDVVEREEIAQIVRSAVEALLGGATIGISREQARAELLPPEPEPEPKPKPERPPPRAAPPDETRPPERRAAPFVAEVGGFYEAELYDRALWHGPGVVGGITARDTLSPGGRLSLQYRAPMLIEGDRFGARLQALALRALARLTWARYAFVLAAGAGAGADLTHVDPTRVSGNGNTAPASWDVVPVVRATGAAGLDLSGVRITTLMGADYDLIETRHVAERNGEPYTVLEAPRLRPFFGLELTLAIEPAE